MSRGGLRVRQPKALDIRSILEAAFEARDEVPDLWALWLAQAHGADDGWHERPAQGEPWRHHASAISECLRRSVFDRAMLPREPLSVESQITFEVGHHIHALIQFGLAVHPEYRLLAHEVGGDVALGVDTYLTALGDAVYQHDGMVQLLEIKSESQWASTGRRREAKEHGRVSYAKPQHMEQMKVQDIVLRTLRRFDVEAGWVVYWEKNAGQLDQQPVDLGDAALGSAVRRHINEREQAWTEYVNHGHLPPPLPEWPNKGLCQPRSKTDVRGRYCPYRIECLRRKSEADLLAEVNR